MAQPSMFLITRKDAESTIDPMELPALINRHVSLGLAPISGINVGAVGLGASGDVAFLGINVEFPGLPLHHSIHAVQFLVANIAINSDLFSERHLRYLAVSANDYLFDSPCGNCLQFLHELHEEPEEIQILIRNPEKNEYVKINTLLPRPHALLPEIFPLPALLQKRDNGLALLDSAAADSDEWTLLKIRALAEANKAFAPYSDSPSGVALMDDDGKVYGGWYMESFAFNPSLGPLQMALVDFLTHTRGKEFTDIVKAVVVEKKDAKASQEKTVKMILETIADTTDCKCVVKVFHCIKPLKP